MTARVIATIKKAFFMELSPKIRKIQNIESAGIVPGPEMRTSE